MSKIDEARPTIPIAPINLDLPEGVEGAMQQLDPPYSIIDAAQHELEGMTDITMRESTEDMMSLALGTRVRDQRRRDQNQNVEGRQNALLEILSEVEEDEHIQTIINRFGDLGKDDSQEPFTILRDADLSVGAMVMVLGKLLGDHGLEAKRRRRLEKALAGLIEDEEDWELQLFSFLEVGSLPSGALAQIRSIYRRHQREEGSRGLPEWFSEVQGWPDRRSRIRVLLRALSFDLSVSGDKSQQVRLAAAIHDLRRLLLFLSIEEHSQGVSESVSLDLDVVLSEVLATIEQSWLYPEWLEERLVALNLPESQYPNYLRLLGELISLLPEPCFNDVEQKEQIMTTFLSLQDRLNG